MFFTKKEKDRIDTELKTHQESISKLSLSSINLINLELRVEALDKEVKRLDSAIRKITHPLAPYGYKKDGTPAKKRGRKS